MDVRAQLIARAPLFSGLDAAGCTEAANLARDRRVVRREGFYEQGDPAEDVYVLCAGRLKMTQSEAGGEQVILRLTLPGEAFGALDVEPRGAYPASAVALEASHALAWDRGAFEALARANGVLLRNVVRILGERARALEQRCRELAIERVPARLARTLLVLQARLGRPAPDGVLIELSRDELAQLTGTTLFTVSRLLSEWQDRRLLWARREAVIVTDAARLASLAREASALPAATNLDRNLTAVKDGTGGRR